MLTTAEEPEQTVQEVDEGRKNQEIRDVLAASFSDSDRTDKPAEMAVRTRAVSEMSVEDMREELNQIRNGYEAVAKLEGPGSHSPEDLARMRNGLMDREASLDAALAYRERDRIHESKTQEVRPQDVAANPAKPGERVAEAPLPVSATEMKSAVLKAADYWRQETSEILGKYPGLSAKQIPAVTRWPERQAWLASRIPEPIRNFLNIRPDEIYNKSLDRAYQNVVDKQADALLRERSRALETLRGVRSDIPPHLLPSKQYRAAESLTRIDRELRTLRPLRSEDYGAAVATATGRQVVQSEPVEAKRDVRLPEKQQEPVVAEKVAEKPAVVVKAGPTKHESALELIREMQSQTPIDGYRSEAAKRMTNRLIQQLQEGQETIRLSAKYQGGDQGHANETHRNAVEANAAFIQAVRDKGIPVDTGVATVGAQKKPQVEFNAQVDADQKIQILQ
jgi:hypothetical protein